jgi:hypothetical protein
MGRGVSALKVPPCGPRAGVFDFDGRSQRVSWVVRPEHKDKRADELRCEEKEEAAPDVLHKGANWIGTQCERQGDDATRA